ncbi:MAG TPA: dihydrolipoamide acetyltransferase family protein [Solirubrobacteraceae bacterium]|nr:dihydrolipoamide acetyltransferase family protein [Solirubrobacteraceae bacterium]
MPDVVMPRLSDSMEEGTILKWLKSDGDEIARGDELVEIETDKATMTYEADTAGTLAIVAQEGDTLPIGEIIARIGAAGEAPASDGAAAEAEAPQQAEASGNGSPAETPAPPAPAATAEPPAAAPAPESAPAPEGNGGRPKASPVARRIAREQGIDLTTLQGTGPGGRIVKADVEAAASGGAPAVAPAPAPAEVPAPAAPAEPAPAPAEAAAPPPPPAPAPAVAETGTAKGDVAVQELSRTQQVIARRMAESKATVPHFAISTDVDMEGAVELRTQLKAAVEKTGGAVPSYNDMVVKASAIALREFPRANGSYKDGRFELYSRINVGVAVAAQEALIVPTVFDADKKSLGEIARDSRALAERVRAGVVTPPELSGGTFTVSNLGMFGVTEFTAVINPPQAAILAVGKMEPRAVVRDGEIVARNTMSLTLACDHRILYGADAAEFLARIKALLEQPIALAL